MNPHPGREYMIFETRHAEDIKRAEQQHLPYPRRSRNRLLCRALCGLGHRLVSWGQYLVQHFELPEPSTHIEEPQPSLHRL